MSNLTTCAFCFEPTDRVRVCLTPQCQSCAINSELYPECTPECNFNHFKPVNGSSLVSIPVVKTCPSRQAHLLHLLAETFLAKVQTAQTKAQISLALTRQNINLAQIYVQFGLTSTATVKEQELLQQQLLYQIDGCGRVKKWLNDLGGATNQSPDLAFHYLNLAEAFIANYVAVKAKPLLLSGQGCPEGLGDNLNDPDVLEQNRNVLEIGYHCGIGHKSLNSINCMRISGLAVLPDPKILFVKTYRYGQRSEDKIYYHLSSEATYWADRTHDEIPDQPPWWLPSYWDDFPASQLVTFSPDGVWLFESGKSLNRFDSPVGILKHRTLTRPDCTEDLTITTIQPDCLYSDFGNGSCTQRMVMLTQPDDHHGVLIVSAWRLDSPGSDDSVWYRLWQRNFDEADFEYLSIALAPDHVMITDCDQTGEFIVMLDFDTGEETTRIKLDDSNARDCQKTEYLSLFDHRLHVISHESAERNEGRVIGRGWDHGVKLYHQLSYRIYTLDGRLAYYQPKLLHPQDKFQDRFEVITGANGKLQVVVW